jgi:ketosteroid isomerase-like protein
VFPAFRSGEETRRELAETDAEFATLTAKVGRQKGFDAYVAEDGIQVDDPFIFGRKAIFDSNASVPANSTLLWTPLHSRGAKSSDLGMTVGSYESHSVGEDGLPRVSYGKYLTVWRRDANGRWKFVLDGGNSGPPPP